MPLNPKASVSHNISEMVRAGHPQNQAVAAALNVARNAKAMGGAEDSFSLKNNYFRRTNTGVDTGAGYSMYAAGDPERISNYGKNLYMLDKSKISPKEIIDVTHPKFKNLMFRSLINKRDEIDHKVGLLDASPHEWKEFAKNITEETNPKDIVDSAGTWDMHDSLVPHIWEHVMEPNGWTVAKTHDGAISFDPSHSKQIHDENEIEHILRATGGGLYANIHAKQERIAHGSHEHMRKPGAKGALTAEAFRASERTAKADGGFLPVGNPERNDNFKNWFGKSKIVTKNGNPLIVYHSSPEDFDKFKYTTDKTTGVKTNGFYFTPDKNYSYISGQGEGRKVYPVHVKMENPYFTDRPHVIEGLNSASDAPAFIQKLKDMGHDGVIYSNPKDIEKSATGFAIDSPQIFAFHPHQIKSAIGNNGQFDPTNSDITKKVGGYIAKADGGGFSNNQQLGHVPELAPVPKAPTMGNKVVVHEGPIHSPVAGRTDHLPMHVKSGSYVIPADIIGAMGEGNTMAGFKVARRMFSSNPYFQKSMSPYGSSSPIYNSDEKPYGARAAGGGTPGIGHNGAPQDDEDDDLVPIVAAGGEYVISPQDVTRLGEDDIDDGHKTLDSFVTKYRKKTIKVLQNLPGPHRD